MFSAFFVGVAKCSLCFVAVVAKRSLCFAVVVVTYPLRFVNVEANRSLCFPEIRCSKTPFVFRCCSKVFLSFVVAAVAKRSSCSNIAKRGLLRGKLTATEWRYPA